MDRKNNVEIRTALKDAKLTQWMLADLMGICEHTMLRRLRHEIEGEEKVRILAIINDYKLKNIKEGV